MKKPKHHLLDFEVDALTNSITNTISGDSFPTEVSLLVKEDLHQIQRNRDWNFNWRQELNLNDRDVYKLSIVNNPKIIQGAISLTVNLDHVFVHLLENAPYNRGKDKLYEGVPGNLVAFACKLSFQSKTKLIDYYINKLGAYHFGNHLMVIETMAAQKLVDKYFKI